MKGRKSLEIAEFLEKRFNDTVSRSCWWWQEVAWAGYGRGATEEPFCLSSLGKAAQNLLVPSCSMVLYSQNSADGSPGNTSKHNMSADVHKKRREKMRRSSSTLISCSSSFSNSKGVWVWMGLERDLSFAFPAMWHSWEKRWGPFLAATLPGGRGDVKAAESSSLPSWPECWKLPRVVAQVCTFIVLVLRAFAWNGESLTEGQMLETCPSVTWHLGPCRSWKLWKARRAGGEQGSSRLD